MDKKVVILAGGVGGAKMAEGFQHILPAGNLSIIVNTGDDFEHYGLKICPDIDTVCYTLAGLSNPDSGWGRAGETWQVLAGLRTLEGEDWFRLGDKDLATHLERTKRMKDGDSLTDVTAHFCEKWGIKSKVFPMTNEKVETIVHTDEGKLSFQNYFVAKKCEPKVSSFDFEGIDNAQLADGIIEAIEQADLIVIAPSNPWVSIDPILLLGDVREVISKKKVVAISPIVGGKAIKGPAAKMYGELGITPSAVSVFRQYQDLLDNFVIDEIDMDLKNKIDCNVLVTNTIMKTVQDKSKLAMEILKFVL